MLYYGETLSEVNCVDSHYSVLSAPWLLCDIIHCIVVFHVRTYVRMYIRTYI